MNEREADMNSFHEQYVVDEHGNRSAVLLPLADWQRVLEDLEELDDAREYDEAKRRPSEPVVFEQAVQEIRQGVVS
jgi:PHD/YefM family antitoxin component YafN of YafNO toxin-antitoxin module